MVEKILPTTVVIYLRFSVLGKRSLNAKKSSFQFQLDASQPQLEAFQLQLDAFQPQLDAFVSQLDAFQLQLGASLNKLGAF